jgi:hypothetical protein
VNGYRPAITGRHGYLDNLSRVEYLIWNTAGAVYKIPAPTTRTKGASSRANRVSRKSLGHTVGVALRPPTRPSSMIGDLEHHQTLQEPMNKLVSQVIPVMSFWS